MSFLIWRDHITTWATALIAKFRSEHQPKGLPYSKKVFERVVLDAQCDLNPAQRGKNVHEAGGPRAVEALERILEEDEEHFLDTALIDWDARARQEEEMRRDEGCLRCLETFFLLLARSMMSMFISESTSEGSHPNTTTH